jgi:prepilin-type N-terminal cleavage/methylation domain-containing protein
MIKAQHHSRQGFTLIELVFVMILVALMGGVAMPRITSTMGLKNKSSAIKMAGFLQNTYQQALLSHQAHHVIFDLERNEFWAEKIAPAEPEPLLDESVDVDEVLMAFRKQAETFSDPEEIEKRKMARRSKITDGQLKPSQLQAPLSVAKVFIQGQTEQDQQGIYTIPISASGYHPFAIVYIALREEIVYSIVFPPLGGRATVEKGEVDPDEVI